VSDEAPPPPPRGPIAALGGLLALAGGATLLGIALLTAWSVVQRWLTSQPVPGDFELVSIGSGVAVLGFLAWGTVRARVHHRGHLHHWAAAPRGGRGGRALDAGLGRDRRAAGGAPVPRCAGNLRQRHPDDGARPADLVGVGLGALAFAATALAALSWVPRLLRGEG
jgi:Co/Zn/Cd efflux system component